MGHNPDERVAEDAAPGRIALSMADLSVVPDNPKYHENEETDERTPVDLRWRKNDCSRRDRERPVSLSDLDVFVGCPCGLERVMHFLEILAEQCDIALDFLRRLFVNDHAFDEFGYLSHL